MDSYSEENDMGCVGGKPYLFAISRMELSVKRQVAPGSQVAYDGSNRFRSGADPPGKIGAAQGFPAGTELYTEPTHGPLVRSPSNIRSWPGSL